MPLRKTRSFCACGASSRGVGGGELERRDAHGLASLQPRLRLRALAVHAHFAFADDALDVAEGQAGKARLEEAVDAHIVFVGRDGDGLHAGGILRGLRRGHRWRRGLRRWRVAGAAGARQKNGRCRRCVSLNASCADRIAGDWTARRDHGRGRGHAGRPAAVRRRAGAGRRYCGRAGSCAGRRELGQHRIEAFELVEPQLEQVGERVAQLGAR